MKYFVKPKKIHCVQIYKKKKNNKTVQYHWNTKWLISILFAFRREYLGIVPKYANNFILLGKYMPKTILIHVFYL